MIIFQHFERTGGMSVVKSMEQYGLKVLTVPEWRTDRIAQHILNTDHTHQYDVINSHGAYGIHQVLMPLGFKVFYVTLLRDPIERAISHYYWIRKLEKDNPDIRDMGFLDLAGQVWFKDYYTTRLVWQDPLASFQLLQSFTVLGSTEAHNVFLKMLNDVFAWNLKPIKHKEGYQEVSASHVLTPEELRYIETQNIYDIELWDMLKGYT